VFCTVAAASCVLYSCCSVLCSVQLQQRPSVLYSCCSVLCSVQLLQRPVFCTVAAASCVLYTCSSLLCSLHLQQRPVFSTLAAASCVLYSCCSVLVCSLQRRSTKDEKGFNRKRVTSHGVLHHKGVNNINGSITR